MDGAGRFDIRQDDCTGPEIAALIDRHLRGMQDQSPPDAVHALGLAALMLPAVTVWTAWDGPALAGCGALKQLDPGHVDRGHGEIKSMRTDDRYLRRGVAAALLGHIIGVAKARGYRRLSLETGSTPDFVAAHRLYERHGFTDSGAFGGYSENAFSRFLTLDLAAGDSVSVAPRAF